MELIYTALLLHKAGQPINEENVKKVLQAANVKAEEAKIKALVAALDGVDIDKAVKEAAVIPSAQAPAEVKKEEKPKVEEKKPEAAAAGLASLFG